MRWRVHFLLIFWALLPAPVPGAQQVDVRKEFRIKYGTEGVVYLDGGQNAGLNKGMTLTVKRPQHGEPDGFHTLGEVQVTAVGTASAVCEIRSVTSLSDQIQVGDIAYLSAQDVQTLQAQQETAGMRRYPQVVTFTEGDPLDEKQREYVPRAPSPEINRARGRIGMDYTTIRGMNASIPASYQVGFVVRADVTRIGGTYWNLSGYYRGRFSSQGRGPQQQTLTDLINRTYQIGFIYSNPQSKWVMGIGRLFLPWAPTLSTIDGGYFARRLSKTTTAGIFGGSTPDPSAWNYSPGRQIAGSFLNYESGSFDATRFSSTVGLAVTRLHWKREREFAFAETGVFYKRYFSIYHSMQADMVPPDVAAPGSAAGGGTAGGNTASKRSAAITQSFLTVRIQPNSRFSFDVSHNYFRNTPTFDPRLIGTGLVEKFLFEGFSGSVRVELPYQLSLYSSLGRSSRSGDVRPSWNQLYGVTMGRIWRTGIRADLRYSKFDSSFGRGTYQALSLSRQFGENMRWEIQGGQQDFLSSLTRQNRARWINSNLDWQIGIHYYVGAGFTYYGGGVQVYNQIFLSMGYRF
ncbi:MAG: hypothetical protein GZ088_08235 [Acidipila sp.]|nr:hypothetical protein [Acidipila sp.]